MTRIGLAGCGRIARLKHLAILRRLPGAELVAIAEPDPQAAAAAAEAAPDARLHPDLGAMLSAETLDAVVICLPTPLHAAAAVAAFEAGLAVYLEKPIATSLEEGRAILEAWRASGRPGMTGFSFRFAREFKALRDALAAGGAGPVLGVRTTFTTGLRELPAWKRTRAGGGGVLLDLASHHVDLLRTLLASPVAEVSATISSVHHEDDRAAVQMVTASGMPVQSFFAMSGPEENRIELLCEGGTLVMDRMRAPDVHLRPPPGAAGARLRRALDPRLLRYGPDYDQPFRDGLATFVEAAAPGGPSLSDVAPDLDDGFESLRVVVAAERAARSGRTQRVEADEDPSPA